MTEGRKYKFRVVYLYPDKDSMQIQCITFDKALNTQRYLLNTGEIKEGNPSELERKNIVSYVISQKDKWDKEQGIYEMDGTSKLFGDFEYYNEDVEKNLSKTEASANRLKRLFHGFIKEHECFRIVDKKTGLNCNPNISIALFGLEDIGAEAIRRSDDNKKTTHLSTMLTDMVEDFDQEGKLVDLAFALGIVNVYDKNKEDLYNTIMDMAKINPDRVQDMIDNQKQWLYSIVEKGISIPISDKQETAISFDGEYYMLNGTALGKDVEDLVKYFETNSGALTLLEQKLGSFREKVKLPKIVSESPISVNNGQIVTDDTALAVYEAQKGELKKKVYAEVYNLSKAKKTKEKHLVWVDATKSENPNYVAWIDEMLSNYYSQFKVKI